MNTALQFAKINTANSRLAIWISLGTVLATIISNVISYLTAGPNANNITISSGSYGYLFLILLAIFTPSLHFRRFMHLNVKKSTYIRGCVLNYLLAAAAMSLFNLIFWLLLDGLFAKPPQLESVNLISVFGWDRHGVIVAFLQQTAFMLLLLATLHTLTTIQTYWYGWLVDVLLVTIISVFTPIAVLRPALIFFFDLIIFQSNPLLQILACLILAVVIYTLSIRPVEMKRI